jgi:hypothetical protein
MSFYIAKNPEKFLIFTIRSPKSSAVNFCVCAIRKFSFIIRVVNVKVLSVEEKNRAYSKLTWKSSQASPENGLKPPIFRLAFNCFQVNSLTMRGVKK